ncbi:inorganic phosphate transporter 1-4-like [Trifolium pratense]|uniref:inorganic phosphate transporter 1-4-like n=1 Tax=Trifolium pratense TaxID=57577 RepID=UPI001E692F7D|nr:inorganic phosphate transporter 1-4-like [Trifolium pratense]XP_045810530.1 inorganic phosphate transporter 1-4-like [Trifolium pratense]XP_045810531.1 inorganic phosphate transporter 1-4-like [Trifolium pratense]
MAREQLGVLSALDAAKVQWYHFTAIIVAGMGFFTDAYDLFCIPNVTKLLGRIYYTHPGSPKPGTLPPNVSAAVNGVALCGTLAGQLFFGWLGDKMGRKKVYGLTLALMVFSSLASGLSFGHSAKGTISTLCFFRFWLGFGIGGDYPLSATIMSEYANKKTRGAFIASVFAMQGFGILAGGIVSLVVSTAFDHAYKAPPYKIDPVGSLVPEADYVWRIILMFGAVPAALTYYWRMKMPETARYTALVAKNAKQAAQDMSNVLQVDIEAEQEKVDNITVRDQNNFGLFSKQFLKRHGLHLLGTTSTWFLLDIAYYSSNLFQKDIYSSIGWLPPAVDMNAIHEVFKVARATTLIALCGTVPGYWFTVAFIDVVGRFAIQLMGFFFMTVFMFALALPYDHWTKKENRVGFLVMYALTFFFANFGPNSTTFVVPAEIFPARLRSTCHGISSAAGKAGAIIGAFGFLYASQSKDPKKRDAGYPAGIGMKNTLIVLAVVNCLGIFCTFLVPEANGKSLEEMSGENEEDEGDDAFVVDPQVSSNRTVPV